MKDLLKPIIVLTVICIVTAGLLGATYNVTKPLIDKAELDATNAAMREVMPSATNFTAITELPDVTGLVQASKDDGGAGYVFKVESKGFGGAYPVMVGIGADGKITGAKLLEGNSETPGLGSKTGNESFTGQFIGKDSSLSGVETITGATISSKAFISAVGIAYEAYTAVGEGA
ncbi:MAG: FMN-binding protein [Anaerotruncus rubiinfantis]|jgi:electron transport complex protein RnfG|uniref:FMN-binding protein n=1 Tax=Anaerotruncus rubiinfantis TaxID=1720200 RepID=UPI00189B50EB|nr:FMN-binding protein [Anaerotruncus rubiinfantis]